MPGALRNPSDLRENWDWVSLSAVLVPHQGRPCRLWVLSPFLSPSTPCSFPLSPSTVKRALTVTRLSLCPSAGNFRLAELGVCEPAPHQSAYCSDLGLLHRGYSLSAGSDADSDPEGAMSPDRAIQLWGGHGVKSRRSSGLSSRENSALTLTDSDNENKSDEDAGRSAGAARRRE
ncbi:hypothetical protein Z043_102473 [Scleropages formosus]|uniref:Teneurin N-terminal domain-containing protein n=1 Tax=Scleropages formosus TaxID=113540 RepID=A0A0P7VPL1_SCLFO|nr:hypothetical protein Z043_102473 [Scleropages formosus]